MNQNATRNSKSTQKIHLQFLVCILLQLTLPWHLERYQQRLPPHGDHQGVPEGGNRSSLKVTSPVVLFCGKCDPHLTSAAQWYSSRDLEQVLSLKQVSLFIAPQITSVIFCALGCFEISL